jgi:hypothetical protein
MKKAGATVCYYHEKQDKLKDIRSVQTSASWKRLELENFSRLKAKAQERLHNTLVNIQHYAGQTAKLIVHEDSMLVAAMSIINSADFVAAARQSSDLSSGPGSFPLVAPIETSFPSVAESNIPRKISGRKRSRGVREEESEYESGSEETKDPDSDGDYTFFARSDTGPDSDNESGPDSDLESLHESIPEDPFDFDSDPEFEEEVPLRKKQKTPPTTPPKEPEHESESDELSPIEIVSSSSSKEEEEDVDIDDLADYLLDTTIRSPKKL